MAKRIRMVKYSVEDIKPLTKDEQKQFNIDLLSYAEPDEETKQYYLDESMKSYEEADEIEVLDLSDPNNIKKYVEKNIRKSFKE